MASPDAGPSGRGEVGEGHGRALSAALLAAVALLSAAAPSQAQSRPPSSLDLNLGGLGEVGAIAPVRPDPPSAAWGTGGRYGAAEMFGRLPDRPLPHMPPNPGAG